MDGIDKDNDKIGICASDRKENGSFGSNLSCPYLLDSTVLPALTYASETLVVGNQVEHAMSISSEKSGDDARSDTVHASDRIPEFQTSWTFEDQRCCCSD